MHGEGGADEGERAREEGCDMIAVEVGVEESESGRAVGESPGSEEAAEGGGHGGEVVDVVSWRGG